MSEGAPPDRPFDVARLHAEVDARTAPLVRRHGERLRCGRGCHDCCVDGLTVFEVEADLIRQRHGALLEGGRPHAEGGCAFLGAAGDCRIYAQRPYVCRTQGLPLRWTEGDDDGLVELRDLCPLNEPDGPPVEDLPASACWTLGEFEGRLAQEQAARQARSPGDALRRVALRSLFVAAP